MMATKLTLEQMQRHADTQLALRQHELHNAVLRGDDALRQAALRMVQRMAASFAHPDETHIAHTDAADESEGTDRKRSPLYS